MANSRVNQFVLELGFIQRPNAVVNQFVLELGLTLSPPVLSCNNPPAGTVNVAYAHALVAPGGTLPYTYSILVPSLPPGLSLNASTGNISGVPTSPGTYTFTALVVDANLNSSQVVCQILIAGGPVRITLRGVNRRRKSCEDEKFEQVPELSKVKRAV